jgi:hypothetical protein
MKECEDPFSEPNNNHKNKGRKRLLWLREVQAWGGKHKYEARKTNHTLLGFSAEIEPHGLGMRAIRRTACHSPLPYVHHRPS